MELHQDLTLVLWKNFIPFVKRLSKRTRRRRGLLDAQIAKRNYKTYLIDNSLQYMETLNLDDDLSESQQYTKLPTITRSRERLKFKKKDGNLKVF